MNKEREEIFLSSRLPRLAFVAQGVMRTHDNLLFCVLKIEGARVLAASDTTINKLDNLWHHAITSLDSSWALYAHTFRTHTGQSFNVKGKSEFTSSFVNKYRSRYEQEEIYTNDHYLTLIYTDLHLPPYRLFNSKKYKAFVEERLGFAIENLKTKAQEFCSLLKDFKAKLLDFEETKFSAVLSFLSRFVNGLQESKLVYPTGQVFGFMQSAFTPAGKLKYPIGNLVEYISDNEIIFGDSRYLIFKDPQQKETWGCLTSLKAYGEFTTPTLFDDIFKLDSELLFTVSFRPLEKSTSQYKINRTSYKHEAVNDAGVSQHTELFDLKDEVATDKVTLGRFHTSVMILAKSKIEVDHKVQELNKIFHNAGCKPKVEDWGLWSAYFAQFPTNFEAINRLELLTSKNFAHFFPMHSNPSGHTFKTHLGEALCLVDTPGHTSMWFNYARRGENNNGENNTAHTYIIGATGSGKTVMLLAFDALYEKYNAKTFFFDYGLGAYNYFKATANPYFHYHLNNPTIKHNPFLLEDSLQNRAFLVDFLCLLVLHIDEKEVPEDVKEKLTEAVNYAFHLPALQRTLSNIVDNVLGEGFRRFGELKPFLRAAPNRDNGIYCNFFDNSTEVLNLEPDKVGFDMTALIMDHLKLKTALLKYLFHRIELSTSVNSPPTSIILDEGWSYLDDPSWTPWFISRVPTLRKNNIAIIIATQSAETVLNCPVATQIITNSATGLFAPNETASFNIYQHFGVTLEEVEFIKNAPPRQFLYKQVNEVPAVISLNLKGLEKELAILSSTSASRNLVNTLIEKYGDNPTQWLPPFYEELK